MQFYRKFMQIAIEQANIALSLGDVPVGAVIVQNEKVIAKAYNCVCKENNPLAHAEMKAIASAIRQTGSKYLNDCTMFVTLEPCPMCAGAIVLARIGKIVFAASEPKFGSCGSLYNIASDDRLNHQAQIIGGIMENECSALLKQFFSTKR